MVRESTAVSRAWERTSRTLRSYEYSAQERIDQAMRHSLDWHRWVTGVHFVLDASWPLERWRLECERIEKAPPS